jgi:sugar phosphate isomerase/epimerase
LKLTFHAGAWGTDHLFQALNEIRAAGFQNVEVFADVATVYEGKADEFQFFLQKAGLNLLGAYGGGTFTDTHFREVDVESARSVARWIRAAGGSTLILQGGESTGNSDLDIQVAASTSNLIGWACNAEGIDFCFQPHMGTVVSDEASLRKFLRVANPELVHLCLDTAHLGEAQVDIVPLLLDVGTRVRVVHLRDLRRKPVFVGGPFTNPGHGVLDLSDIVATLRGCGYDGWVVGFSDDPRKDASAVAKEFLEYAKTYLRLLP